jgi:hypothetical protein
LLLMPLAMPPKSPGSMPRFCRSAKARHIGLCCRH